MPYINPTDRSDYNYRMEEIVRQLKFCEPDIEKRPGPTNYIITRIVARALKPESGWSYNSLSRAIAVLRDAATEMERRLMAPYEDAKIGENGDVQEYVSEYQKRTTPVYDGNYDRGTEDL
jgi:hypothetical protein